MEKVSGTFSRFVLMPAERAMRSSVGGEKRCQEPYYYFC